MLEKHFVLCFFGLLCFFLLFTWLCEETCRVHNIEKLHQIVVYLNGNGKHVLNLYFWRSASCLESNFISKGFEIKVKVE